MCVHGLCAWMQGQLSRFVMAPGCVIVVICSATCNLRQTRFTSSVHTWKPANVSVNVRVSFLPTSLRRCFSSFFFSSLFFGCHFAVDRATYTHTQPHAHAYLFMYVWRYLYQNIISWVCYVWRVSIKKAGEWVKERDKGRERESSALRSTLETRTSSTFWTFVLNNCHCCCCCLSVIDYCRS